MTPLRKDTTSTGMKKARVRGSGNVSIGDVSVGSVNTVTNSANVSNKITESGNSMNKNKNMQTTTNADAKANANAASEPDDAPWHEPW